MTHCCGTLIRYLPWWIALGYLLVYESLALIFHWKTLSQLVWRGNRRSRWFKWIALGLVVLLVAHFWLGLWGPAAFDVGVVDY